LINALNEDGIIAIPLGSSYTLYIVENVTLEKLFRCMEKIISSGAMFVYEEPHTGYNYQIHF